MGTQAIKNQLTPDTGHQIGAITVASGIIAATVIISLLAAYLNTPAGDSLRQSLNASAGNGLNVAQALGIAAGVLGAGTVVVYLLPKSKKPVSIDPEDQEDQPGAHVDAPAAPDAQPEEAADVASASVVWPASPPQGWMTVKTESGVFYYQNDEHNVKAKSEEEIAAYERQWKEEAAAALAAQAKPAPQSEDSPSDPSNSQLPPGWTEEVDSAGYTYYFNDDTGESRWDRPTEARF